jgi:3'-phosphoadenosine 5'-phosphosulfate sulfotransferase (PAPS reductase)/FAD synthetase
VRLGPRYCSPGQAGAEAVGYYLVFVDTPGIDKTEPSLADYDWIVVNSSAGKDSQTMLRLVAEEARRLGLLDRVVVAHADLGKAEWAGVRELAQKQAELNGVARFWYKARPQGDFLELTRQKRHWPMPHVRDCTSALKRNQIATLFTELTARLALPSGRQARILNCLGMRAAESPGRAMLGAFIEGFDENRRRRVDRWLPIHAWTTEQVWADVRSSGIPYHPAYDLGMKRLSCIFCIFADRASLMMAGKHNPELLAEYVALEHEIGRDFKHGLSLAAVQSAIKQGEDWGAPLPFAM